MPDLPDLLLSGRVVSRTMVLAVSVASVVLSACGRRSPDTDRSTSATGARVIGGEAQILNPTALAVAGEYLVVADAEAPFLRLFSAGDGRLVNQAGREGEGPREFRSIAGISVETSPSGEIGIMAFDYRLQRLTRLVIADTGLAYVDSDTKITIEGGAAGLAALSNGTLVATGVFRPEAFTVLDAGGAVLRRGGEIPFLSERVTASLAQQVIDGRVAVEVGGSRLAIAARYAGRIDIYDTDTGTRDSVMAPMPFEPEIRTRSNGAMDVFVQDGQTRFGYLAVASSRCCIYGLFSGRTRSDLLARKTLSTQLHVFDWNGKLRKVVNLDRDLRLIAVNPEGSALFGLSPDPEPTVFRYELQVSGTGHRASPDGRCGARDSGHVAGALAWQRRIAFRMAGKPQGSGQLSTRRFRRERTWRSIHAWFRCHDGDCARIHGL